MEWPASDTSSYPKVFAHRDYNDEGQNIDVSSGAACVHSDTPGAARLAEAVVRKLKENDIEIRPSDAPQRFSQGAHTLADETVKAQMPRTFYRAPDPESDPYGRRARRFRRATP